MQGDAQVLIHSAFLMKVSVLCIGNDNLSMLGRLVLAAVQVFMDFSAQSTRPLTLTTGNCCSNKLSTVSGKKYLIFTLAICC